MSGTSPLKRVTDRVRGSVRRRRVLPGALCGPTTVCGHYSRFDRNDFRSSLARFTIENICGDIEAGRKVIITTFNDVRKNFTSSNQSKSRH